MRTKIIQSYVNKEHGINLKRTLVGDEGTDGYPD